jgi:NAD(P)-dependent dehydrogenase (short-subunit alcohol dehydrogenase family)
MEVLSTTEPDFAARMLPFFEGVGVDITVEAISRNEIVAAVIESVRKGGTVVVVVNISPEVTLPLQKVVRCQISLQGSCASAGEYPRAIELISSGAIRAQPLISAVAPLKDGPQWFERLYAREANLMKVVLAPGWFRTEQNKAFYENKEWVEYLIDRIPVKRPGQPEDLDAAIVFLAAESSRYVTGQTLLVDGGISTGATRALVATSQADSGK